MRNCNSRFFSPRASLVEGLYGRAAGGSSGAGLRAFVFRLDPKGPPEACVVAQCLTSECSERLVRSSEAWRARHRSGGEFPGKLGAGSLQAGNKKGEIHTVITFYCDFDACSVQCTEVIISKVAKRLCRYDMDEVFREEDGLGSINSTWATERNARS